MATEIRRYRRLSP